MWLKLASFSLLPALVYAATVQSAGTQQPQINLTYFGTAGRLMRVLNYPKLVLPTHWDNFTAPYEASEQREIDALQSFVQEVKAASPDTQVIVPKYFEPIRLP